MPGLRTIEREGSRSVVRKPRLLYATPSGQHPKIGYVMSSAAQRMTTQAFEHRFSDLKVCLGPVHMARNEIAKIAMATHYTCESKKCVNRDIADPNKCPACGAKPVHWQYDYVLMHDDDLDVAVGPTWNAIDEMFSCFDDPKVGIVGLVYLRGQPRIPTLNLWHPVYGKGTDNAPGEQVNLVCGFPNEPFEVAGVGTGFMLVRREVFEAIHRLTNDDPFHFWPYQHQFGGRVSMGEDFYFCWRAQQCGWKVLADPRTPTVHIKDLIGPLPFNKDTWGVDHKLDMPAGAKVIEIDGMSCIDVSECREGYPGKKAA